MINCYVSMLRTVQILFWWIVTFESSALLGFSYILIFAFVSRKLLGYSFDGLLR